MLKKFLRSLARSFLFTTNTIRYRVEYRRLREIFRKIGKQEYILDGGAGSGEMLRRVFRDGFCRKGVALEPDPVLYNLAVENYAGSSGLEAVNGGLLDIPFGDNTFDCVMSTQVLEHIEDHILAAKELGRVLKKDGYLVVSVPHPPEPFRNPGHVREGYTESTLVDLFPASQYTCLGFTYFLTRPTLNRMMAFEKLPFRGVYLPAAFADAEHGLSEEQRKAQLPFGIMASFRKIS